MQQDYDSSLARLLAHEGGYTNNASDPGGPTNFGITIYDYRHYVKPGATALDVCAMTLDEAKGVYRPKYWDALRCDDLPAGMDYAVFDYGVNSGIGRSGKVLRRILGLSDNTSVVDDSVVTAALAANDDEVIAAVCTERMQFLQSLRTWPVFGRGWGQRVVEVKAAALAMVNGTPLISAASIVPAQGRAIDPDEFARIRALQTSLTAAGFDPGAIDGDLGPKTVKAFQLSRGLNADGLEGAQTKPLLDAALVAAVASVS